MSDRIEVDYRVSQGNPAAVAEAIRVEQTIEFPFDLAPDWIREEVVGRVELLEGQHLRISYDIRTVAGDLVQLLNLLWGNVSLFPGVRITGLQFPPRLLGAFRGPRYGVPGLRQMFDAPRRPLVCTALKPMGMSSAELAAAAVTLAEAGFDLIKDDHGLADQPWATWRERVRTVSAAVQEAADRAGTRSRYMPALNVPCERLLDAAHEAKAAGAGALLVLPGLTGVDALRMLADDDELGLPIMSHPSFLGSQVVNADQGIDHGLLLGTLLRLAGADLSIFPNHGGRFSFSPDECADIRDRCAEPMGDLLPTWPTPGGGMTVERIGEMRAFYGADVALLIGGALHRGDLAANARRMMDAVRAA